MKEVFDLEKKVNIHEKQSISNNRKEHVAINATSSDKGVFTNKKASGYENVGTTDPAMKTRVFTNGSGYTSISQDDYILSDASACNCKTRVLEANIGDH